MATGSHNLTTYYAKRIIGDAAAATPAAALLQTGENVTANTWILHRSNRSTNYGIMYKYDSGDADTLELYGGVSQNSTDIPTAWVQLDTGDFYIKGKVGIGYNPNTSGNSYKLYVDGSTFLTNTLYFNGTTYYINNSGTANLYGLTVNDTATFKSTILINSEENLARIHGRGTSNTSDWGYFGFARNDPGDGDLYYDTRFRILNYSYDSTDNSRLNTYEYFELPAVSADLDTSVLYNILTTKNTITVGQGGTSRATLTANAVLYGNGTSAIGMLASANGAVYATEANGSLSFGTLPVGQGGTGKTSWTKGGILYASATNTLAQIADGSASKVLRCTASATYSWLSYTSAATASTIVYRDSSKNFSAGTITANLTGDVTGNCSGSSGSCTGLAAKATADGDGNTISSTYLKKSGGTVTGQLVLSKTTDAAGGSANAVALVVGGEQTAQHIEINGNEILSKSNGTTPSTLYLQDSTGTVSVSGSGGLAITATTETDNTSTGALRVSGGVGIAKQLRTGGSTVIGGHLYLSATSKHFHMTYNSTNYAILYNHNNGNVSIRACGGGLYMGYANTTLMDWINGKMTLDSSGNLATAGDIKPGSGKRVGGSGGALYLGNSNNASCVYVQDICSQASGNPWKLTQAGALTCTTISCTTIDTNSNGITAKHGHDLIVAGNEFNFIPDSYNSTVLVNYQSYSRNTTSTISNYQFMNGSKTYSTVALYAGKVYNAVWNDFAEYRQSDEYEGGRVLTSDGNGKLIRSTKRLQPASRVISDTFGCSVGQSDTAKTPIGVAGRVLVYPYQDRNNYKVGDAVCAAPDGTADIMTRDEIILYPDRIIGIVDEIPQYEYWEQYHTCEKEGEEPMTVKVANIEVKGRIWIYVR